MVLFCFERWLKKAFLQLLKRICIVLLLFQKMAGYGAAVAAKDGWLYAVVADKKSCCCQKWLAKALLQLLKKGFAATKEGWQWPCWVAKIVLLLLGMVLLLLLEMASNSAVAAVEKGISPALDGAITLTKIGWQMSYWCSCWKNCCCCQRWLVQAL